MSYADRFDQSYEARLKRHVKRLRWHKIHIDPLLITALLFLSAIGCVILYSAGNQNFSLLKMQLLHFIAAFLVMILVAQIKPTQLKAVAPWLFSFTLLLLIAVLAVGHVSQGAKRWLGVGPFQIQPSEMMKLAMPLALSWYLSQKPIPISAKNTLICFLMLAIPSLLIIKQPDLGTAMLMACSGLFVIIFAGVNWKVVCSSCLSLLTVSPLIWHHLHQYQKQRILTLLSPEKDPLGTGYNIIQSKIAVGSGGLLGKGYLNGTQSHMSFLPAHTTDFIFAVTAEEWGFIGCLLILTLFFFIFLRCLYISLQSQNAFNRLLAGSLSCTFFINAVINIGMVLGVVPVVGVPLPLISYGGSSILTTFIEFGIIMSIHTNKKLWNS